MTNITLNFFGEEATIETPKDIPSLRGKICEKYLLSTSDAAEIILYYINDNKKIYIINGNDFSKFKESKISKIFLDVNQNSKLYLDNVSQLEDEKQKGQKKLNELNQKFKQFSERKKKVENVFERELKEIDFKIMEMNKIKCEIIKKKDIELMRIKKEKEHYENKIYYLQKKLSLPFTVPIPEEEKVKQKKIISLNSSPKAPNQLLMLKTFQNNSRYNTFKNLEIKKRKEIAKCKAIAVTKFLALAKAKKEQKEEIKSNSIDQNIPVNTTSVFLKVNEVLSKAVEKVKEVAKEQIMKKEDLKKEEEIKEEKEKIKKEEEAKKLKEKEKKEQIDKIMKIAKETVREINNLTKMVIIQSNMLIEQIINPEKKLNVSSDDIILKASNPNQTKKRDAIHFRVSCDGCKMNPIRGNRYKCKGCENFDFCESCYQKNKESHGHEFNKIEKPKSTRRLGHKNTKYCQRGIVHKNIRCEGCGLDPMVGWRYMCTICDDYNLCENCEQELAVRHNHPFIKVTYPSLLDSFDNCYLKMNYYVPNNTK